MQVPISEARAKLPQLVKQLQQNPTLTYEITIHHEVVAELKAPAQLPQDGEAARKLLALIEQLPKINIASRARFIVIGSSTRCFCGGMGRLR